MRVSVLHDEYAPGRPNSCTYIRLLRPFTHPEIASEIQLEHSAASPSGDPELVIVERHLGWPEDTQLASLERLLQDLRLRGIPFLYTLDDNFLDLNAERPWEPFPSRDLRHIVAFLARNADAVLVSTEALKRRLSRLNPLITVVPNYLDERLFGTPLEADSSDPLTIGYMGTLTHERDLMMILRPLRSILRRHQGRVRLELVGVARGERVKRLFDGLPVTTREPGPEGAYPLFPAWMQRTLRWDVGIAPLEDNAFTRCKSDLKFLDYAAIGAAGVFSDVEPYRTVSHRGTGLLVRNEPEAWESALEDMLSDRDLRMSLARAAWRYVSSERMLRGNARQWLEALASERPRAGVPKPGAPALA